MYECEVILPEGSPIRGLIGKPEARKSLAKQSAAFEACILLRNKGLLDEHFVSTYQRRLPAMRNAKLSITSKKTTQYSMIVKPSFWRQGCDRVLTMLKFYGCFKDDNSVYLIMEYIEGIVINKFDCTDVQRMYTTVCCAPQPNPEYQQTAECDLGMAEAACFLHNHLSESVSFKPLSWLLVHRHRQPCERKRSLAAPEAEV